MAFLYKCLSFLAGLSCLLSISVHSRGAVTANNSAGQTTTAYTNGNANVPIYVWCTTAANPTPASLTATPTTPGTYTFQWYKHNAANFQWTAYSNNTGTVSTIGNLANGGYKVEIKNGSTIIECFHVWVWNFIGNAAITKTGNCSSVSLGATITANDTFTYYNPPPPPSLINSSTQITVCFSATHTWVSDLGFYVVGPPACGSPTVVLSPNPGSIGQPNTCNNGDNVNNLCFSNTSATHFNMCSAATPLSGTYGSYGPNFNPTTINWAPLVGCDAATGGWKVQIYDCTGQDVGVLTGASITFSNLTSVCGSPTTITHASGSISSPINDNSCSAATASVFNVPSPFSLPIKAVALRTFTWSSPTAGVIFTNPSAPGTTVTVPSGTAALDLAVNFTIGTAQCGANTATTHTNPVPVATATPLKDTICSNTAANITLAVTPTGSNLVWGIIQNGVTGASIGSGSTISQTLTATGNTRGFVVYTITPANGGCSGAVISDTVFVDPAPVVTSLPARQVLCSGGQTNFNLSSPVPGAVFTWTPTSTGVTGVAAGSGASISQTLTNTGTVPGSVLYTISVSANGCNGISIQDTAIVNPILSGTDTRSICQGQSYVFNGVAYTSSNNTAKDTLPSVYNCDSIVTLNLTVNPYLLATRNVTICQGQSYTFNGVVYTSANNTAKDTISSATTCDSIVTLNLIVNPYVTATRNVSICQGQSYTFNGVVYTSSNNTAKDTLPGTTTCDSIITLNLTVSPYIQATRNVNICQGQSYVFNGVTYTSSNNTAKDTVSGVTTCDSILTLNLTVQPYLAGTRTVTICQGQSYTFNGITYTTANNTAKDTLPGSGTCDSLITLNLTVKPASTGIHGATICQGQSYTFNGIVYTTGNNTAKDTFTNALGCDSIVTLNLSVLPYLKATRKVVICAGQTYVFNGTTYTVSNNTATDTLTNPSGCDSLITLNLTVLPLATGTDKQTICFGQSYTFNGVPYTTTNTTAKDTLIASSGCDSFVSLDLTVLPAPYSLVIDTAACGSITVEGITYSESTYINDTVFNRLGCDSVYRRITIVIHPSYALTQQTDTLSCDSLLFEGVLYYRDTVLQQDFKTVMGCDSLKRTVNITIKKLDIDLNASTLEPYVGETVLLEVTGDQPYYRVMSWSPASLFTNQEARNQYVKLYENTTITVEAITPDGCIDTASLDFRLLPLDYTVSFPNAFTPNGDGRNDVFRPLIHMQRAYTVRYFRIKNRWGLEVFHQIAQNLEGWDGTYKGVPQEIGVYFYYIEIEFVDGYKVQLKGDVTLLR